MLKIMVFQKGRIIEPKYFIPKINQHLNLNRIII